MRLLPWITLCLALAGPAATHAHGGGLNGEGCHNNRKTGDYHCHRGGGAPASRQDLAPRLDDGGLRLNLTPGDRSRPKAAFSNCAAARAAGAAPVRRGDPGYGAHLDRDSDGVGCE